MYQTTALQQLLALKMEENDSGAVTIKGYLLALLKQVITKQEGFSGKRPFGTSGWTSDLFKPMIQAKLIAGRIDEQGYIEELSSLEEVRGLVMILEAIELL